MLLVFSCVWYNKRLFFIGAEGLIAAIQIVADDTDAEFSPWIEERLPHHRVQTAFPQLGLRPNCGLHLTAAKPATAELCVTPVDH